MSWSQGRPQDTVHRQGSRPERNRHALRHARVLTLWPRGKKPSTVSTLNAADGAVTSKLVVVPTLNVSVTASASNGAHMVPDVLAYFAP